MSGDSHHRETGPGLSRVAIVEAAIAFIDEHGLARLSMRRLGDVLQVEAMSLYRHIPSKEDLLDAVVETLIAGLEDDELVHSEPQDGWQDFLQRLAHGLRRMALAHPHSFPLLASRPVEAPWLRPPLGSLDWVERFLGALADEGFSDEAAVAGYRAFTGFLLGHLLLEAASQGADIGRLDLAAEQAEPDGLRRWPTVRRFRTFLAQDHAATEFEDALESLLDRTALILRQTTVPTPRRQLSPADSRAGSG